MQILWWKEVKSLQTQINKTDRQQSNSNPAPAIIVIIYNHREAVAGSQCSHGMGVVLPSCRTLQINKWQQFRTWGWRRPRGPGGVKKERGEGGVNTLSQNNCNIGINFVYQGRGHLPYEDTQCCTADEACPWSSEVDLLPGRCVGTLSLQRLTVREWVNE